MSVPAQSPRLTRLFRSADVDAVVVVNDPPDPTFFWATGLHHGGTFEGSMCVLRPDQAPLVLTTPLEETTVRKSANEVVILSGKEAMKKGLADALGGTAKVGIAHDQVTLKVHDQLKSAVPDAQFVDVRGAVAAARMRKDPDEVEAIRRACALTDELADGMAALVPDAGDEAGLAAILVARIMREGAKPSFDPIVGVGAGSAEPHYAPARVKLTEGPLLVDMGAKLGGYCSDITRTYSIGEPTKRLAEMHATVLEALEAAKDAIAPGVTGDEVHAAAVKVIDGSPFKGRFIHSTGHGLGIEVHDPGRLTKDAEQVLEEGMVFTVEPGVYVPGEAGVRIEDDVVVTARGCDVLTRADRELRILSLT